MRRIVCMLMALLICGALVLPAMAEETIHIPSNGPVVQEAAVDGEDVMDCLVITSIPQAKGQNTDITQEERDLLIQVYNDLSDGTTVLPITGGFRYLELSNVSFAESDCRGNDEHAQKEAQLTAEFKLDVVPEGELLVFAYIDEKWEPVENAVHHGNGVVTCTFDNNCPVVFVDRKGSSESAGEVVEQTESDTIVRPESRGFVPSITYKDGPTILECTSNMVIGSGEAIGDGIDECVVVTTITQAKEKSTDVTQIDRDLLLDVYGKLADGSEMLPMKKDYVILELVDISFECNDCRVLEDHGHKDACLKQEGVTLTITFDLGIEADANLVVMSYVDGKWEQIERFQNNGDGTVTCVFEDLCPVAFVLGDMEEAEKPSASVDSSNPATGDAGVSELVLWVGMMIACASGIAATVVAMRKKRR